MPSGSAMRGNSKGGMRVSSSSAFTFSPKKAVYLKTISRPRFRPTPSQREFVPVRPLSRSRSIRRPSKKLMPMPAHSNKV